MIDSSFQISPPLVVQQPSSQALAVRLKGPQPLALAVAAPRQRLGDRRRQRLGGRPARGAEQRGHRGGGSVGRRCDVVAPLNWEK